MKFKKFLLIFTALAAVSIGAVLPSYVLKIQDNKFSEERNVYETGNIEFTFAPGIEDALKLLSGSYSTTPLDNGKVTTKTEALEQSRAMLDFLFYSLPLSFGIGEMPPFKQEPYSDINPSLIISADGSEMGIYWECTFYDDYGTRVNMLLDDNTGKMVSFSYYLWTDFAYEYYEGLSEEAYAQMEEFAKILTTTLAEYYGFEIKQITLSDKSIDSNYIYDISFLNGEKEINGLQLSLSQYSLIFNGGYI